jgi:hypothetical protein
MLGTFRSSPWLWGVWAAILVAFVVLQPGTSSPVFWALAAAAIAATVAQMTLAYRRATVDQETIDGLSERLSSLGAILDLAEGDDADVLETLNDQQWEDVFLALTKMPRGSRSLRKAILQTHPQALE